MSDLCGTCRADLDRSEAALARARLSMATYERLLRLFGIDVRLLDSVDELIVEAAKS